MAIAVAWLIAVTVLGAAAIVVHLWLLVAVWQSARTTPRDRWLALIPPLLPWVSFRSGARVGPFLWWVMLVAYLVLRVIR